ncbi:hypothetical protein [Stenotrophomonas rhizophila]|jgi:hypothetical protein|nr:hypothetical protein [Stenotrophomonas rhizophila]
MHRHPVTAAYPPLSEAYQDFFAPAAGVLRHALLPFLERIARSDVPASA